jgi:hypothetical protein
MVSPALSQLLERARARFGLDVEVLDAGLKCVYPEGGSELDRMIQDSPSIRRALLDALAGARPERLHRDGVSYQFYPLRHSPKRRLAAGLLAIRQSGSGGSPAVDAEPWSEIARAVVETDLAASETLGAERQRSRRLSGAFRFVEFITEIADEPALSRALVQAAAVWYDVDARIYRRDLSDAFVLDTWLPGVRPDSASDRLSHDVIGEAVDLRRLSSAAALSDLGAGQDVLLVPISGGGRVDWALALIGSVPADAEVVLRLISRVAGMQYAGLVERRVQVARQQFDGQLSDTTRVPELVAVRVVHLLAEALEASSGSLTLRRQGLTRRIAAVGSISDEAMAIVPAAGLRSPDRIVCTLTLGGEDAAVLDLRAGSGRLFSSDDAVMAEACARALRTWLAGALTSFDATAAILDVNAAGVPPFLTRIQEELERARRFDLRLSLILIDVHAPSQAMAQLQDALRRELRGSDVTGAMGGTQVAALLTHTGALGLDNVVRRVRQRLADTAERLNVSGLKLGQAAFSPEVRTADALLELALRQAEPVIVH